MKFKVVVIMIMSIFLFAGCSQQKQPTEQDSKVEQQQRVKQIRSNRKIWNNKVSKATRINQTKFKQTFTTIPTGYNDDEMSLTRLRSGNQAVLEGQVINLTPMLDRGLAPETKATIYVRRVVSGDKSLQGQTIETEFSGGLTQAQDLYKDFGINDAKTIVYDEKTTFPMPKIGSLVVMGVGKYQPASDEQQASYKKYGLTTKNFYPLNNSEVTFWIKSRGKFKLNNPAFSEKSVQNKYKNIFEVTKELNQMLQ